jgi:hypothetical protein
MAEARFGSNTTGQPEPASLEGSHGKDQSLFLRGFKLALSESFRSQLKMSSLSLKNNDNVGSSKEAGLDRPFERPQGGSAYNNEKSSRSSNEGSAGGRNPNDFGAGTSINHSYGRNTGEAGVKVDLFPARITTVGCFSHYYLQVHLVSLDDHAPQIFHPCDDINDLLLEAVSLLPLNQT